MTAPPRTERRLAQAGPVLLLVLAFVVFSWGIWNARVGLGDDTTPLLQALQAAETGETPRNLYVLLYTFILRLVTPDPVNAALVMRTGVSLGTTLTLFYVLTAFRPYLQRLAAMMACAVWMVSYLNAPLVQTANLSPFTFCLAALGLGWLLRRRSWKGLFGFTLALAGAASLRPEYFAPALLIGGASGVGLLWSSWGARFGPGLFWGGLLLALVLMAAVLAPRLRGPGGLDRYLLLGLGQCYADFYRGEHPETSFDPMTEYQPLLDATFGHPRTFFGALAHNPGEALRYFTHNTLRNLQRLGPALLSTRQTMTPSRSLGGRWPALFLLASLLVGGALLAWRSLAAVCHAGLEKHRSLLWQLLLVGLFCSASSVAILMLVPSPRYWISWVPLLYLPVAAGFDALLRLQFLQDRRWLLWAPALVLFCRPLFLGLGPNENYEVNALRSIAPLLPENPVIAGIYIRPLQAYAFRGRARSVNAWDGLSALGVERGQYDVLLIDPSLRASRIWHDSQPFFANFEAAPARYGYVKLTEAYTADQDIYYRPRVAHEL